MQVDNEEVEELSDRIIATIGQYMTEVAELNPSEIALALSLAAHKLWQEDASGAQASAKPAASPKPAPAPAAPAAKGPPVPDGVAESDDDAIDAFLDE